MHNSIRQQAAQFLEKVRRRKAWRRVVCVLACLVLVGTAYTLILPGVTLDEKPLCGREEHIHTEACYTEEGGEEILRCTPEELGVHRHSEECYNEAGELICPLADYVLHTHDERCYDDEGRLICQLEEHQGQEHIHTEACYNEAGELICQRQEVRSHVHTEECFVHVAVQRTLTCGKEEHRHTAACYPSEEALEPLPETEGAWAQTMPVRRQLLALGVGPEIRAGGVNMTNMIQNVTMQHRPEGTDSWKPLPSGSTIQENDDVKFDISYTVPGGTLSPGNDTLVYQLPKGIRMQKNESGKVYDSATGQAVGTYQIGADGKIRIQYNADYVDKNSNNQPIQGTLNFVGKVDRKAGDGNGDVDLKFKDDLTLELHVDEHKDVSGDIKASKTAWKHSEDGTIDYTVRVDSPNGTNGQVTLTEQMVGAFYQGNLQVTDSRGQSVSFSGGPQPGDKNFTMTLPQMKPGEVYTITYKARLDGRDPGTFYGAYGLAENKVKATSKNSEGVKIESSATTSTPLYLAEKTGKYDAEKDIVYWTLKINREHMDLSGWTMEDIPYGVEEVKLATMTDSQGKETTIHFPYTFPQGSTDEYTITYATKPTRESVKDKVGNEVKLKKGNEVIAGTAANVGIGERKTIEKKGGEPYLKDGVVIVPWTVTVHSLKGITDNVIIGDLLPDDPEQKQYMTRAQLDAARAAAEAAFEAQGIRTGTWAEGRFDNVPFWDWNWTPAVERYRGFRFYILDKTDKTVSFTYETTAESSDEPITLHNNIDINNDSQDVEVTYEPPQPKVDKYDPAQPGAAQSEHQLTEIKDGVLVWKITVYLPKELRSQPVTVTEKLPEGMELQGLKIRLDRNAGTEQDVTADPNWSPNGTSDLQWPQLSPETLRTQRISPQEIQLTLPAGLNSAPAVHGLYELTVEAKLTEEYLKDQGNWSHDGLIHRLPASNTVTVETTDEKITDTQTQVIVQNDLDGSVQKTGKVGENNVVHYTVDINPEGKDYDPTSDEIAVTDMMTHTNFVRGKELHANLVPGSVHLETIIGESVEVSYTYEEQPGKPSKNQTSHLLKLKVPDGQALRLYYDYRFFGEITNSVIVMNTVKLTGLDQEHEGDSEKVNIKLQDSGATAKLQGITIYKVDAANQGVYLPGAEFALYRWDKNLNAYRRVTGKNGENVFRTEADGHLTLSPDTVAEVSYNTAYQLVETKAPEGYFLTKEPYTFLVKHTDEQKYPMCVPKGFQGAKLRDGSLVYYTNEKNTTQITVVKHWEDMAGQPLAQPGVDQVKVKLYRQLPGSKKELVDTYTIQAKDGWKLTIKDLPRASRKPDGTRGEEYIYSVKEVPVPGFETSYDQREMGQGTLGITNRKESSYELPETGGAGVGGFLAAGAALMTLAVWLTLKRHKQGRREQR